MPTPAVVAERAEVGARGVDSYPLSTSGTEAQLRALAASGIDFWTPYLGAAPRSLVEAALATGLGVMPVTVAGAWDGAQAAAEARSWGMPPGTTVWLDLEGEAAFRTPPLALTDQVNRWATAVAGAGYEPGLYVASPQPLTGEELYRLEVVRYWTAASRLEDRDGRVWDEPWPRGWCMRQLWPSKLWRGTGVFCDVDYVQQDRAGCVPTWARARLP